MFYDQFVRLCDERGEKPTPVAKRLGCASSNIAMWKKGSIPRPQVLEKIADYFGVTTQYLLFGDKDAKKSPTVAGEGMSELDKELYSIWETADDDERRLLLDMAKMLKNRRNPN